MVPTLRRMATWVIPVFIIAAIIVVFVVLVSEQRPREFWDSSAYLETARRPFSVWHFFYPKPVLVSAIYRVLGPDSEAIAIAQEVLAATAWTTFAAVLALAVRRPGARIAVAVAVAVFLLHPIRVGFVDVILSESIDDSLIALGLAALLAAVALPRARRWCVVAFAAIATAWLLVRDTNPLAMLAAAPICGWAWRRALRARALELVCAGWLAAVSGFALWSTGVTPPPTGLTFQAGWPADFLARHTYSAMNNVFDRVVSDPEASAFFVAHGLPQADELRALTDHQRILFEPRFAPVATWIATHARGVYLRWLLRHPFARAWELVDNTKALLGADDRGMRQYMPSGWYPGRHGPRDLLSNRWVLGVLALLWLVACRRSHRRELMWIANSLVIAGLLSSAGAYYGDSSEIERHCYGSGQIVLLGMVVAAITLLDARRVDGR